MIFCLFETNLQDYRIVLLPIEVGHRVVRILRCLNLNVTSVHGANHSRETFHLLKTFHYFVCPCTWEVYTICFREILLFLHNLSKGGVIRPPPPRFHQWHISLIICNFNSFVFRVFKGGGGLSHKMVSIIFIHNKMTNQCIKLYMLIICI